MRSPSSPRRNARPGSRVVTVIPAPARPSATAAPVGGKPMPQPQHPGPARRRRRHRSERLIHDCTRYPAVFDPEWVAASFGHS